MLYALFFQPQLKQGLEFIDVDEDRRSVDHSISGHATTEDLVIHRGVREIDVVDRRTKLPREPFHEVRLSGPLLTRDKKRQTTSASVEKRPLDVALSLHRPRLCRVVGKANGGGAATRVLAYLLPAHAVVLVLLLELVDFYLSRFLCGEVFQEHLKPDLNCAPCLDLA